MNKDIDRFESKISDVKMCGYISECALWGASKDANGYGLFHYKGRMKRAHVVAYELYIDMIPDRHRVVHLCGNSSCVAPDHLALRSCVA